MTSLLYVSHWLHADLPTAMRHRHSRELLGYIKVYTHGFAIKLTKFHIGIVVKPTRSDKNNFLNKRWMEYVCEKTFWES